MNCIKRCHGQRHHKTLTVSSIMVIESGAMLKIKNQSQVAQRKIYRARQFWMLNSWAGSCAHFPLISSFSFISIMQSISQEERFLASSFSPQLSKPARLLIEDLCTASAVTRTHCCLWEAGEYLPLVCHWSAGILVITFFFSHEHVQTIQPVANKWEIWEHRLTHIIPPLLFLYRV